MRLSRLSTPDLAVLFLLIGVLTGVATDNELTGADKKDGWLLLFDGKTLDAWITSEGKPSRRPVDQGCINPHQCGHYMMVHTQKWSNFVLTLDFKISKGCNSGIFVRTDSLTPRRGKDVGYNGIEVQILDTTTADYYDTGAIYDLSKPTKNTMKHAGEWNNIEIKCDGSQIEVLDAVAARVQLRVIEGMWLIVLHSVHLSKPFRRLMGTSCHLCWREAGERERVWVINPGHPISRGIDRFIELENSECYGEPFGIPAPAEQVFISWFEGGEVFRSGNCWVRGSGRIFYFGPGHESYPIYHHPLIQRVIYNAILWARPQGSRAEVPRHVPAEQAREKIVPRGLKVHDAAGSLR